MDLNDTLQTILQNTKPDVKHITPAVLEGDKQTVPVMFVPNGMTAKSLKPYLDEYLDKPVRRSGVVAADSIASYIDFTNRYKGDETVIFARGKITESNELVASLTTVFDYHPANPDVFDARHGGFRVKYDFPISKEFQFWLSNNGNGMEQSEFALLLEERIGEMAVVLPDEFPEIDSLRPKFADPLEILELSRDLEIYSQETIKQAGKLSSGEREIKFSTEHCDANGQPVKIPDFFLINVPIFRGGNMIRVAVRLRYRKKANGNGIIWSYDLYRIDRVFEEAFEKTIELVKLETELPLFLGRD